MGAPAYGKRSSLPGSVEVFKADLRQPEGWVAHAAAELLDAREHEERVRGAPDVRRRRLMARIVLRVALSRALGCPPRSVRLVRTARGKPILATDATHDPLHFNLSRSGDCCLVAITRVGPVGVDVERLATLPDLRQIAARRFTPGEVTAILRLGGEARLRAFYDCWTRKEAYLKARGAGLTGGLDKVAVSVGAELPAILSIEGGDPGDWSLRAVEAGPGLVGALVVEGRLPAGKGTVRATALPIGPGQT